MYISGHIATTLGHLHSVMYNIVVNFCEVFIFMLFTVNFRTANLKYGLNIMYT